jgi:hypothetical protein
MLCYLFNFVEKWAPKADKREFSAFHKILSKNEPQKPIKGDLMFLIRFCLVMSTKNCQVFKVLKFQKSFQIFYQIFEFEIKNLKFKVYI